MSAEAWQSLKASLVSMEVLLAAMQELRKYITHPDGLKMLDATIKEAERELAELRRRVVN